MRFERLGDAAWPFGAKREGNVGVEFALLLPILALVLFGTMELGRALHDYHLLDAAVRDAARFLSRQPIECSGAVPGGCATCDAQTGLCAGPGCVFANSSDVKDAVALAMTGSIPPWESLLAYWPHPPVSPTGEVAIQICAVEDTSLAGPYGSTDVLPHVRLTANADFTLLFGQSIAPTTPMRVEVAHNVVVTGQ